MMDINVALRVIDWLAGRDVGISSKAIALAMCGSASKGHWGSTTPSDPGDLGRCLRLLALFPEWTPDQFKTRMSQVSHEWACFAEDWPKLAASMTKEVGIDWSKGQKAPKTYALMKATERRSIETNPDVEITHRDDNGMPRGWRHKRPTTPHMGDHP